MIDPTEGTVLKDQPGFGEGAIAEEGGEQDAMSPDGMQGDMEMEMDIEEEDSPD